MTLLDTLRSRSRQRELNAIDVLAEAARAAAAGKSYDVAAIEKALADTGETPAEFEAAVDLARKRLAWLADFEKFSAASAAVAKLEKAAAAEQAKFEAARRAFMQRADAIDADLAVARSTSDKGRTARGQLLDPRDVPGTIGERYREAVAESEAAAGAVQTAQQDLREAMQRIKGEQEWIAQLTGEAEKTLKPDRIMVKAPAAAAGESFKVEEHRRKLAHWERRKREAESTLTEAEKVAARATAAVEGLIADVLKA